MDNRGTPRNPTGNPLEGFTPSNTTFIGVFPLLLFSVPPSLLPSQETNVSAVSKRLVLDGGRNI